MDLGVPLESPQGSQASSRVDTCTSNLLPSCSTRVTLPVQVTQGSVAFPRGFPTKLSHVPPWCQLKLGATVEAVQGNQVHLGGLKLLLVFWNGGTTPGVPLHFPVDSASPGNGTGSPGILALRSRERNPHLERRNGKRGCSLVVAGPSVFL